MGQVLHGCATTTEAVRRAIQNSQESLRALANRYGINQKTVRKWRNRSSATDLPTGPKKPRSTVLSVEEEAVVVIPPAYIAAARRLSVCPAGDHPASHALLAASLPATPRDQPVAGKKFKAYPIGFFHIDIAEVRTEEGKLYLFVAIDRTSKFAFARLEDAATVHSASTFLNALIQAVPYKIRTVLTDNGVQFCDQPSRRNGPTARLRMHMFDKTCREHEIEHRLTKPNHPWTNGQVERMNRTIKEATVKRYHYDHHDQLRRHLADFLDAYNFARRLKTLKGLTPYEFICKQWTIEPKRFKLEPIHQMPGLNT